MQGQNSSGSNGTITIQDLNTPNDQLNILNEQFIARETQIRNSNANVVLISQVGENNVSTVSTVATNSSVALSQNGNDNTMQLDLRATTIDYQAIQNGDNNLLLEFSNGADTQLLQRSVEQTGNGQNLVIHGNNALSDRMVIRMNNGGQSVIIRNTN
jgi:hypothetical protein